MGRGEQWGEGVRLGDLLPRAQFEARLTGGRGREGVEDNLVLLFSVWGTVDLWEDILNIMKYIIVII